MQIKQNKMQMKQNKMQMKQNKIKKKKKYNFAQLILILLNYNDYFICLFIKIYQIFSINKEKQLRIVIFF